MQSRAHHKSDYLAKLDGLIKQAGMPEGLKGMPAKRMEFCYETRIHPFRVVSSKGLFSDKELKMASALFRIELKKIFIPLFPGGEQIDLFTFYTLGMYLASIMRVIKKDLSKEALYATKQLQRFIDYHPDRSERAEEELSSFARLFGLLWTELDKEIVWVDLKFSDAEKTNYQLVPLLTLHKERVETSQINSGDKLRPAVKLCFPTFNEGLFYMRMSPHHFGFDGSFAQIPLQIFMQAHAFARLRERLDFHVKMVVDISLYVSLSEPFVVLIEKGRGLIEMRFLEQRVGYLVAEVIEGVILIKTFLFLTNDGTPEANKLSALTGLHKLDKQYLSMDKLSSFIGSDLSASEELKELFTKAGCGSLFNINTSLFDEGADMRALSDSIQKYLGKEKNQLTTFSEGQS